MGCHSLKGLCKTLRLNNVVQAVKEAHTEVEGGFWKLKRSGILHIVANGELAFGSLAPCLLYHRGANIHPNHLHTHRVKMLGNITRAASEVEGTLWSRLSLLKQSFQIACPLFVGHFLHQGIVKRGKLPEGTRFTHRHGFGSLL